MKVLGCITAFVGFFLCALSATLFGVAISRAMDARAVVTQPLEIGEKLTSEPIKVDTSKFCMVSLKATVKSDHAVRKSGTNEEYELQYSFPFQYSIQDTSGKPLISEDTKFAHNTGNRTFSNDHVTRDGGDVQIQSNYEKVQPPASGEIVVVAVIGPDETYSAQLDGLELIVYDNVSRHAKSVTTGVVVLFIGGFLMVTGVALFLFAMLRSSRKTGGAVPPPLPPAA